MYIWTFVMVDVDIGDLDLHLFLSSLGNTKTNKNTNTQFKSSQIGMLLYGATLGLRIFDRKKTDFGIRQGGPDVMDPITSTVHIDYDQFGTERHELSVLMFEEIDGDKINNGYTRSPSISRLYKQERPEIAQIYLKNYYAQDSSKDYCFVSYMKDTLVDLIPYWVSHSPVYREIVEKYGVKQKKQVDDVVFDIFMSLYHIHMSTFVSPAEMVKDMSAVHLTSRNWATCGFNVLNALGVSAKSVKDNYRRFAKYSSVPIVFEKLNKMRFEGNSNINFVGKYPLIRSGLCIDRKRNITFNVGEGIGTDCGRTFEKYVLLRECDKDPEKRKEMFEKIAELNNDAYYPAKMGFMDGDDLAAINTDIFNFLGRGLLGAFVQMCEQVSARYAELGAVMLGIPANVYEFIVDCMTAVSRCVVSENGMQLPVDVTNMFLGKLDRLSTTYLGNVNKKEMIKNIIATGKLDDFVALAAIDNDLARELVNNLETVFVGMLQGLCKTMGTAGTAGTAGSGEKEYMDISEKLFALTGRDIKIECSGKNESSTNSESNNSNISGLFSGGRGANFKKKKVYNKILRIYKKLNTRS